MTYTEYRICEYKLSIGSTNKYSATVTIYVEPLTAFVSAVVLCKTNKKKSEQAFKYHMVIIRWQYGKRMLITCQKRGGLVSTKSVLYPLIESRFLRVSMLINSVHILHRPWFM